MFDLIIKEATNRFNLGDKALPLVQVLVAAMTHKNTGGISGFIERFKSNGLGNLVDSWMNSSAPLSINHVQIAEVLGGKDGLLAAIDSKVGLDKGTALMSMAYLLPGLFNKLAPGGTVAPDLVAEVTGFTEKGLALLGVGTSAPASQAQETCRFEPIVNEAGNRFNLGDKALPLVQALVAAMTHKDTGGLTGFIERFKSNGLGNLVDSWMNSSAPLSINHVQIAEVLGGKGGLLDVIDTKVGLDKGTALLSLAYLLPTLFNKLAPGGAVASSLTAEVTGFAEKGLALLDVEASAAVSKAQEICLFEPIIEEVSNRFNLGDKALPLVQALVAAMTHKDTGGLTGFIERFKSNGLGNLLDSWMNSSAPLSINHVQIAEVLGGKGGLLDAINSKVGLDKGTALLSLAYLLPTLFNKLAPGGTAASSLTAEVTRFAEQGLVSLGAEYAAASLAAATTGSGSSTSSAPQAPVKPVNPVPVTRSVPKPVSADAETAATQKPIRGGGILKHLLWIIPILLGILLFKIISSKAPDDTSTNSATTSLPAVVDSVAQTNASNPVTPAANAPVAAAQETPASTEVKAPE